MLTNPANTVLTPKDYITNVRVIFDGGNGSVHGPGSHFSVAVVTWDNVDCIAIRWNITEREWDDADKVANLKTCVGEPNSRGYATWFILPEIFLSSLIAGNTILADQIKDAMAEIEKAGNQ